VATTGSGHIDLIWNPSAGATSYTVKRRNTGSGPTFGTTFPVSSGNSFSDTSVTNGTSYDYEVTASNVAGESGPSNIVTVIAGGVPPAPSSLSAKPINATNSNLAAYWPLDGNGQDATLQGRDLTFFGGATATSSGLFGNALSLPNNPSQYAQRSVADGFFDINNNNNFTYQTWVNFSSTAGDQILAEKYSGPLGSGTGWAFMKTAANSFRFVAAGSMDMQSPTQSINPGWHQLIVRKNGFEYEIIFDGNVIATNVSGISAQAASSTPLLIGRHDPLSAGAAMPLNGLVDEVAIWGRALADAEVLDLFNGGSGYMIGMLSGNPHVDLTWASSAGATGYTVLRSNTSGGPYSNLFSSGGTFAQDTNSVNPGNILYYVVVANNGAGSSGNSPQASAALVVGPTFFQAVNPSSGRVDLSWFSVFDASGPVQYRVRRWKSGDAAYAQLALQGGTSFSDSGLSNGTTYYYLVSAVGVLGEGASTDNRAATPGFVPSAPTNLVVLPGGGRALVSWDAVGGAAGYRVKWNSVSGGPYINVVNTGNQTATDINFIQDGVVWYFVVSAVSADGIEGPNSNEVVVIPHGFQGPDVTSSNPSSGNTNVSLNSNLVIHFNQPMDHLSTQAAIAISSVPSTTTRFVSFWSASSMDLTLVFDTNAQVGTIEPDDLLLEATTYFIDIGTSAKSQSNVRLDLPRRIVFSTVPDATPPQIVSMLTNGGQDPRTTTLTGSVTSVTVSFNKAMNTANSFGNSGGPAQVQIQGGAINVQAQVGQPNGGVSLVWTSNSTLVASFAPPLPENTVYRMNFNSLNDVSGNFLNTNDFVVVTARTTPDSTAPTIVGSLPINGDTNVPRDSGFFVGFSEPMRKESLSAITLSVNAAPPTTPFTMEFNDQPPGIFIQPLAAWPASALVSVSFGSGVQDTTGNSLAPQSISFQTAAASVADSSAMVLDAPYSGFKPGTLGSPTPNQDTYDFFSFMLFKNSSSGLRDPVNQSTVSLADVTIVEDATGIPVKGWQISTNNNGNGSDVGLSIQFMNQMQGLNSNTVYRVTLNASLQNSRGVPISPVTYYLSTVPNGGNAAPSFQGEPQNKVVSFNNGGSLGIKVKNLQAQVSNGSDFSSADAVGISVQDLTDTLFVKTQASGGSTTFFNFNYQSSGPEPNLSSTGAHTVLFTATDTGSNSVSVKNDFYVFSLASLPTLTGPTGTIATQFPSYSWTAAGSDAQAIMFQVSDASSGATVYSALLPPTALGFTQPPDMPLPAGATYQWGTQIINFKDGIVGGNYGNGQSKGSFSVSGTPGAPARFAATAGYSLVQLSWVASPGASGGYKIYRSVGNNTSYSVLTTATSSQTSFTDNGLSAGTIYFYKLTVVGSVESAFSGEVSATPLASPAAPALTATQVGGAIHLSWTAVPGSAGYTITRHDSFNSQDQFIGAASGTTASDSPLVDGRTYVYTVTSTNSLAQTAASNQASIAPLQAPSGMIAAPAGANVFLTWPSIAGATSYNVYRSTTSGVYGAPLASAPGSSYTDSTALASTQYFYVVAAQDSAGASVFSPEATVTLLGALAAPAGLSASAGSSQVSLSWSPVTGATGYWVKRSSDPSATRSYGRVTSTSLTAFVDTGLPNDIQFFYVVSAFNAGGESPDSSPAQTATPAGPPIPVTDLSAIPGNMTIQLNWTVVTNASLYNIKRSTTSGGPYGTVASNFNPGFIAGNTATFMDGSPPLTNGQAYFYIVTSVNGSESPNSNEASATPASPPSAPVLSASPGNTQAFLNWSASTGATSYNVKRKTGAGGVYGTIATGLTALNFTDNGLVNGTTYFYTVTAVESAINTTNSNEVSVTPVLGPTVQSSTPSGGSTNVNLDSNLVIAFALPMVKASVESRCSVSSPAGIQLQFFWDTPPANTVGQMLTVVFDTVAPFGTITWDDLLPENATVTFNIAAGAQSSPATTGMPAYSTSFQTRPDATPPTLSSIVTNLGDDPRTKVLQNNVTSISVTFTDPSGIHTSGGGGNAFVSLDGSNDSRNASVGGSGGSMSASWTSVTLTSATLLITFTPPLNPRSGYRLQVNGVSDNVGNSVNDGYQWSLVTASASPDSTPPSVTGSIPRNGETGVRPDSGVLVGLSELVGPDVTSKILVSGAPSTALDLKYDPGKSNDILNVEIDPKNGWPPNTLITITVKGGASGITDTAGNTMASDYVFSFTTGPAIANAIDVDDPFSSIKNSRIDIDPNGPQGTFLMKDTVTGERMLVDSQSMSSADFSIVDQLTGIPVKGYLFETAPDQGPELIFSRFGSGKTPLQNSRTYVMTLKNTLKGVMGQPFGVRTYSFTTASASGNRSPMVTFIDLNLNNNATSPSAVNYTISTSTFVNDQDPGSSSIDVTSIPFSDDGPDTFSTSLTPQSPGSSNFQYNTPGSTESSILTTAANHTYTYSIGDGQSGHTMTVKRRAYVFSPAELNTFTYNPPSSGSTPTFTWTGSPPASAVALVAIVMNTTTGKPVGQYLLEKTATTFTQPGDAPLAAGSYQFLLGIFAGGTVNSGEGSFGVPVGTSFTR
jgi:fibronectin type 3 domain-containing protein